MLVIIAIITLTITVIYLYKISYNQTYLSHKKSLKIKKYSNSIEDLKYTNSLTNNIFPKSKYEIIKLKKTINTLSKGGPNERLRAINISYHWGHSSTLPLLRKGLKDSDPRVVQLSALAIQRFK